MADIEVVIKIPEGEYQHIKKVWQKRRGSVPWSYIAFGTPLPRGHGRLVDMSKFDSDRIEREYSIEAVSFDYLDSLPTIIEADKDERSEE